MEEEVKPPSQFIIHNNGSNTCSSSPTIRFLGFLTQPKNNSDSNPFELEESDVIWSSPDDSPPPPNIDSPPDSISPTTQSHSYSYSYSCSFRSDKFGLSAALSHDEHDHDRTLVQRKTSLSPSFSTAARMIAPPPLSHDFPASFKLLHQSAPVNVPIWPNININHNNIRNNNNGSPSLGFFEDNQDEETEEEMLPPHEIVARSHSTTFSVFEGVGRTLKGRDLRRVRNAVWQKTGFLD